MPCISKGYDNQAWEMGIIPMKQVSTARCYSGWKPCFRHFAPWTAPEQAASSSKAILCKVDTKHHIGRRCIQPVSARDPFRAAFGEIGHHRQLAGVDGMIPALAPDADLVALVQFACRVVDVGLAPGHDRAATHHRI